MVNSEGTKEDKKAGWAYLVLADKNLGWMALLGALKGKTGYSFHWGAQMEYWGGIAKHSGVQKRLYGQIWENSGEDYPGP